MAQRVLKDKKKWLHLQAVNPILAIGFLGIFAMLVGVYLTANFKYSTMPISASVFSTAASSVVFDETVEKLKKTIQIIPFESSDDFKSYLDDGMRAYGDGIFEAQNVAFANLSPQAASAETAKKTAVKSVVKNQNSSTDEIITPGEAQRFFSLGRARQGGDIFGIDGKNLFFSPENQFYESENGDGETKILDVSQPESIAQTNFIPHDGDFVIGDGFLTVISENSIFAYDISDVNVLRNAWQARISDGTTMVASKFNGKKLYIALKTKIDAANPCPLKPLTVGEKPVMIDCKSIYHPEAPILADSIFTVFEVDITSGAIKKNLSFVGAEDGSSVLIGKSGVYAVWGQGGDYISFFTVFLQEKCKSLLPNYLMEKAAALPQYDIALSSKELELRALLSNWIATLGPDEQARVAGEINARMKDYLRDHYQDYEKTGIAAADFDSFKFTDQSQVPGRVLNTAMINEQGGFIRMITNSGRGAAQKMVWLVTGKIEPDDSQTVLSNIYILGDKLSISGSRENIDLPAGICAAEFGQDRVYVSTCRSQDSLYAIGLGLPSGIESQGKLGFLSFSYVYPLDNGKFLNFSKNNRKIQISLTDAALPAKSTLLSRYDLNDYWVDMDGNYSAFSADSQNKFFFVPASRGGNIFLLEGERVIFEKNIAGIAASRSFFEQGSLYLLGDDGIDVFGGADWVKTKSIKF